MLEACCGGPLRREDSDNGQRSSESQARVISKGGSPIDSRRVLLPNFRQSNTPPPCQYPSPNVPEPIARQGGRGRPFRIIHKYTKTYDLAMRLWRSLIERQATNSPKPHPNRSQTMVPASPKRSPANRSHTSYIYIYIWREREREIERERDYI